MTAPLRRSRSYIFWGQTTSLCETCLRLVPAKIEIRDNEVWYQKRCPQHGAQTTLVSTDAAYWKLCKDYIKPGDRPLTLQSRTEYGCPFDCGLCPDHEQHSCLALIEINEHCNLACPVCFADSSPARSRQLSVATIESMLDTLIASEGEPDFVARLAEHKRGLEIYLQFDSMKRDALMNLRGADLRGVRQQALENLERHGISTTLVVTVKRGVNDDEIGAIVRHALEWRCVRGVTFQPVQDAGRNQDFDKERHRIVLSEIRERVIKESGVFDGKDMIPLPCNPETISIAYGLRNGRSVIPVMSLLPREELIASLPNAITFEKQPVLLRKFMELFSLSSGPENTGERMAELLCCLPRVPVPTGMSYENVFRVVIVQFM